MTYIENIFVLLAAPLVACMLCVTGRSRIMVAAMLALRGLSTAMMHLVCGVVMGYGLTQMWSHTWLRISGGFALLCLTMIYHGFYNLLVAVGGFGTVAAVALPLLTLGPLLVFRHRGHAPSCPWE